MLPKKDLKIEYKKGKGPGGQHKNKVETMVCITHIPTGIQATKDGRYRRSNLTAALKELESRVREFHLSKQAAKKKASRDKKIHDKTTIRTYDYTKGIVKDHRTGKTAPLKKVMGKGNLDLLR